MPTIDWLQDEKIASVIGGQRLIIGIAPPTVGRIQHVLFSVSGTKLTITHGSMREVHDLISNYSLGDFSGFAEDITKGIAGVKSIFAEAGLLAGHHSMNHNS